LPDCSFGKHPPTLLLRNNRTTLYLIAANSIEERSRTA
jgi:hypothetical protein